MSSGSSLPAGTLSKLMSVSFKMIGNQVASIIANWRGMSPPVFAIPFTLRPLSAHSHDKIIHKLSRIFNGSMKAITNL
jgi:hypothetical protein